MFALDIKKQIAFQVSQDKTKINLKFDLKKKKIKNQHQKEIKERWIRQLTNKYIQKTKFVFLDNKKLKSFSLSNQRHIFFVFLFSLDF